MWFAPLAALAILALALFAAPVFAEAQQPGAAYRVGVLSPRAAPPGPLDAFRDGHASVGAPWTPMR